jgi:hypothetical protein
MNEKLEDILRCIPKDIYGRDHLSVFFKAFLIHTFKKVLLSQNRREHLDSRMFGMVYDNGAIKES